MPLTVFRNFTSQNLRWHNRNVNRRFFLDLGIFLFFEISISPLFLDRLEQSPQSYRMSMLATSIRREGAIRW